MVCWIPCPEIEFFFEEKKIGDGKWKVIIENTITLAGDWEESNIALVFLMGIVRERVEKSQKIEMKRKKTEIWESKLLFSPN